MFEIQEFVLLFTNETICNVLLYFPLEEKSYRLSISKHMHIEYLKYLLCYQHLFPCFVLIYKTSHILFQHAWRKITVTNVYRIHCYTLLLKSSLKELFSSNLYIHKNYVPIIFQASDKPGRHHINILSHLMTILYQH